MEVEKEERETLTTGEKKEKMHLGCTVREKHPHSYSMS